MRKRFRSQIAGHRLRREIIATLVANSIVNRGLGEFRSELAEQTGRTATSIGRAYIVARDTFALVPLLGQLELVAGQIGAGQLNALLGEARLALARGTEWFLRNLPAPIDVQAAVDRFKPGIAGLLDKLDLVLAAADWQRLDQIVTEHRGRGIEAGSAGRLAALPYLFPACEVVAVADVVGTDVVTAETSTSRSTPNSIWAGSRSAWSAPARAIIGSGSRSPGCTTTSRASIAGSPCRRSAAAWSGRTSTPAPRPCRRRWRPGCRARSGLRPLACLLIDLDSQPSADLAMLSVAIRTLADVDASPANPA